MPARYIRPGEPGYGKQKFVATGTYNGKPYTVRFGDPDMEIKRDDPERRKNFRRGTAAMIPARRTRRATTPAGCGRQPPSASWRSSVWR